MDNRRGAELNFRKTKAVIMAVLMIVIMTSCGPSVKSYGSQDYIMSMPFKEGFRILQLNDIHLGNKDDRQKQYDFIELTVNDADADLIVLCGDLFTFADKAVVKEFCAWMDSFGIPWSVTFGNHDEQCYYSIDWLTSYLNNFGSNCMFKDIQDDDIYGNANYAINLTDGDEIKYQVIIMDSNRYTFGDYWGYDCIREDQIDWYERIVKQAESDNGGKTVPSIAFFHIPFPEFETAWNEAAEGNPDAVLIHGEQNEPVSCPLANSGLFDRMLSLGSTKAVCCAHDHVSNFCICYKGIYLSYGINSDDRIYCEPDMMGGKVMVLGSDGNVGFDEIYHTYGEVKQK